MSQDETNILIEQLPIEARERYWSLLTSVGEYPLKAARRVVLNSWAGIVPAANDPLEAMHTTQEGRRLLEQGRIGYVAAYFRAALPILHAISGNSSDIQSQSQLREKIAPEMSRRLPEEIMVWAKQEANALEAVAWECFQKYRALRQ